MKNLKSLVKAQHQCAQRTEEVPVLKIVKDITKLPIKSTKTEEIITDLASADTANSYKSRYLYDYLTRYFLVKFIELGEKYGEPVVMTGLKTSNTVAKVLQQLPYLYYVIAFQCQACKGNFKNLKEIENFELEIYIKPLSDSEKNRGEDLYNIQFVYDDGAERRNLESRQETAEEINALQRAAGLTETVQA